MDSPFEHTSSRLDNYLDINDFTSEEKLSRALALKDRGSLKFKDSLFKDAHRDYQQAFKFVVAACPAPPINGIASVADTKMDDNPADSEKIKDLKCALYLNIAACLQVSSHDISHLYKRL